MADFRFTVDTEPLAESMDRVSNHVDGVTTAVIAMQAAVIIAEQKAADNVCENLDRGFYTLIRSQISQKIAKLHSDVDSKSMEMSQQSGALRGIKGRMERDFMMIANRYTKLFNSLNNSLRIRIFELDKFASNFVTRDIQSISNRLRDFVGTVSTNQTESIGSSQVIASSKTKGLAFKVVDGMHHFITDIQQQKYLVGRILSNKKCEKNYDYYIPAIITETTGKSIGQSQVKLILPKPVNPSLYSNLERNVNNTFASSLNNFNWFEINKDDKTTITSELKLLVQGSSCPERIKNQINILYAANNWLRL